jgi:hypothetical protein
MGYAGEFQFCQHCENESRCGKHYRKILWSVQIVIDFAYEIEGGFKNYVWNGNLYDQPIWFMQMLRIAQNEIMRIRAERKNV